MLRKTLSRWTSKHEDESKDMCAFTEPFWQYYVDSLTRQQGHETPDCLATNPQKYHASSSAVVQVKALFGPELPQPSTFQVISSLKSPFSQGDVVKAYHFIRYFQISESGFFITNDGLERTGAQIQLVGAENWENVMCYLDSLLFSMFANLDSFEPILFILNQHSNHLVTQLLGLLRVYVNLMRLGNLITTDITQRLCECLMKLGFEEALSHRQQDSAPLFEFLTETLSMPLLTFRVEIQHHGKHEEDDTKYSRERILFVSVPGDDDDEHKEPVKSANEHVEVTDLEDNSVLLEECLEHYFNNSISVKRELERRATLDSQQRPLKESFIDLLPLTPAARPRTNSNLTYGRGPDINAQTRTRASTLSIWSISSFESKPREVMLPAWMLLRLLPFYTDDNNEDIVRNSKEFANRRPVVPICLKRYSFSAANQQASRSKKKIIIPPVIDLPLFVADDDQSDEVMGGFKLILESAVCHRGTTIASGHFVSAVRKNAHMDSNFSEPTVDSPWYLYDDMKNPRVTTKTFKEIFDKEWPYMLFYRLVSAEDDAKPPSKMLSMKSFGKSSPMTAPEGSKTKFWKEEPLSRIPSISSQSDLEGVVNSSSRLDITHVVSSISSEGASSIPIPSILPNTPNFIDIRKRYLWYVTDKEKNYYKESASFSKTGSRNPSISVTPQFRRNSQWSDVSNISGLILEGNEVPTRKASDKEKTIPEKAEKEEVDPSLARVEEKKEEAPNLHHNEHHFSHHHNTSNHESEALSPSSKKHLRKRRADYKHEKCVII